MKLKKYLKENNITQEELIKIIEIDSGFTISQGAISKYVIEARIPRKAEMHAIYKATQFHVSANDFYDLESTSHNLFTKPKDKNLIGAKLIGGPKLVEAAIDAGYVRSAYISVIDKELGSGYGKELYQRHFQFCRYQELEFGKAKLRKYKL